MPSARRSRAPVVFRPNRTGKKAKGGASTVGALSFDATVVTPAGTPLGGWVHVDVKDDGGFSVKFHMHSSSVLGNFDFALRAYLAAPGTPGFLFHHAGHVSGVDDADYEESGTNPLIALYWPPCRPGQSWPWPRSGRGEE
jgi:hypothetical protein